MSQSFDHITTIDAADVLVCDHCVKMVETEGLKIKNKELMRYNEELSAKVAELTAKIQTIKENYEHTLNFIAR